MFLQGATSSITKQIASFGTNLIVVNPGRQRFGPPRTAGLTNILTYKDAQAIKKAHLPQVAAVSALALKRTRVSANGENISADVVGIDPPYQSMQSLELANGLFLESEHLIKNAKVAVLGNNVAKDLFGIASNPVGRSIRIEGRPFRCWVFYR